MLSGDPHIQGELTHVPAPQVGPVTANESAPGQTEVCADCATSQHPEVGRLSRLLGQPEDPNDANESDEADESGESEESDGSEASDEQSDELSADERSAKPWVPPIVTSLDMKFTVDDFAPEPIMSMKEHIMNDEWIAHIYTTFRKTWPSPEDVLNDVDIATTLLSLLVLTTSRKFRLREEWLEVENLRILAEQELVRESLAGAVTQKHFAILRTLLIWYECRTT
ncbi:hypothetical protein CERSUDRAFT_96263 [Gelatoporia subvermispora B]|uniref:Uncharacterized protein n=1 Tax=Ceriporiopsis subvermispora (strain B) TaxID=914234 RepID=M2PIQ5_CERS8|nr:hypothetical protein CERSUDRAFT_96263 [Gelatoporia subvermispora B]